jgi:3-phytase
MPRIVFATAVCLAALCTLANAQTGVAATAETESMPSTGDAADDPAIWVHPKDPVLSLVIGTDKQGGLWSYDLSGKIVQHLPVGNPNNVDVRHGITLGGDQVDIVVASERITNTLVVLAVDPATRMMKDIVGEPVRAGMDVYGLCLYRSAVTGSLYAFVNDKEGKVEQWELRDDGTGRVEGALARTFHVGSQTEGCAADDEAGVLFIGEENVAIWKYGAEPDSDPADRIVIDLPRPRGHFTPDIEGLAVYHGPNGTGYLLASSQGDDTFNVYERQEPHAYVGTFAILGGRVDAVSGTDGIEVTHVSLGAEYPGGLFVAQDDQDDQGNQNFKYVPWESVSLAFTPPLLVRASANPMP